MELIASVTARRSSVVDNDNFLALRFVLMILIGDSFIAAGVIIVWYPTCLLLIVCITCYKCINIKYETKFQLLFIYNDCKPTELVNKMDIT